MNIERLMNLFFLKESEVFLFSLSHFRISIHDCIAIWIIYIDDIHSLITNYFHL